MARRPRGYIFRCNTKILRLCLYMLCDITVGDVSSRRSVFPITPASLRHLLISGGNSHAGFPFGIPERCVFEYVHSPRLGCRLSYGPNPTSSIEQMPN
jgi:hypothetical protein